MNHPKVTVIEQDIRNVSTGEIINELNGEPLHLLAGCPPCQGFSSVRRLNRRQNTRDERNDLILVGSLLGEIDIAEGTREKVTVKDAIGKLEPIQEAKDPLHKIAANHTPEVMERIRLTPKDGGSWKDLPEQYTLECHKKENVGFNDIYGRLRWNDYSATITGGCLNPSKGRFLHPEEDRVITAREAALLQSFPRRYKFPVNIPKASLALLIGNALPPRFSYIQSMNIQGHLDKYLG